RTWSTALALGCAAANYHSTGDFLASLKAKAQQNYFSCRRARAVRGHRLFYALLSNAEKSRKNPPLLGVVGTKASLLTFSLAQPE
ncbi:MAG TPA: hypothetical protein VFW44_21155, partial [Bryobacteraceae bacterium]|nr:hypothetical protein [Bryobacteraceae bacterium]